MTYRLDDADLALLEVNTSSPLVARLVQEIRQLRDRCQAMETKADELYVQLRNEKESE
jgi:hypothetical protein